MFAILHTLPAHFSRRSCSKNPICDLAYLSAELGRSVFTESIRKHSAGTLEGYTSDRVAFVAGSSKEEEEPGRREKAFVVWPQISRFRFFVAEVGNHGPGKTLSEPEC